MGLVLESPGVVTMGLHGFSTRITSSVECAIQYTTLPQSTYLVLIREGAKLIKAFGTEDQIELHLFSLRKSHVCKTKL
jgi:hypothetical protein